jgi:hypothetical protein
MRLAERWFLTGLSRQLSAIVLLGAKKRNGAQNPGGKGGDLSAIRVLISRFISVHPGKPGGIQSLEAAERWMEPPRRNLRVSA